MAARPILSAFYQDNAVFSSTLNDKSEVPQAISNNHDLQKKSSKRPIIVHIKLIELLSQEASRNCGDSFAQRLKKRLSLPRYQRRSEISLENSVSPKKIHSRNIYDSTEKIAHKSSKTRNLEELIAIRRCHLLYS